jgi:hypothetical protein
VVLYEFQSERTIADRSVAEIIYKKTIQTEKKYGKASQLLLLLMTA